MQNTSDLSELEVGFDVPALLGMNESDIQTPCLILDLDVLEKNLRTMADYSKRNNMSLRVHAKMHKSVDVIKLQHDWNIHDWYVSVRNGKVEMPWPVSARGRIR